MKHEEIVENNQKSGHNWLYEKNPCLQMIPSVFVKILKVNFSSVGKKKFDVKSVVDRRVVNCFESSLVDFPVWVDENVVAEEEDIEYSTEVVSVFKVLPDFIEGEIVVERCEGDTWWALDLIVVPLLVIIGTVVLTIFSVSLGLFDGENFEVEKFSDLSEVNNFWVDLNDSADEVWYISLSVEKVGDKLIWFVDKETKVVRRILVSFEPLVDKVVSISLVDKYSSLVVLL